MTKHNYRVEVSADYEQTANSPGQVRKNLVSALKRQGLKEVNFSISVGRIVPPKVVDKTTASVEQSKIKEKKPHRKVKSRRRKK